MLNTPRKRDNVKPRPSRQSNTKTIEFRNTLSPFLKFVLHFIILQEVITLSAVHTIGPRIWAYPLSASVDVTSSNRMCSHACSGTDQAAHMLACWLRKAYSMFGAEDVATSALNACAAHAGRMTIRALYRGCRASACRSRQSTGSCASAAAACRD